MNHGKRLTPALLLLSLLTIAAQALAQNDFTGNLSATGDLDINGNTASFGTNASVADTPGYNISYSDAATATVSFSATRSQSLWKWFNSSGATYPGVVLDASGKLGINIVNSITPQAIPMAPLDISAVTSTTAPQGLIVRRPIGTNQMVKIHHDDGHRHVIEAVDIAGNQKPFFIRKVVEAGSPLTNNSNINFQIAQTNGNVFWPLTLQGSNGFVGVNNSWPSHQLDVTGNARITGSLTVSGTLNSSDSLNVAANKSLVFANGGDSVSIKSSGSAQLQFYVNGNAFEARSGGLSFPAGKGILDQNNKTLLGFGYTAFVANNLQIDNAPAGQAPVLRSVGTDAHVGLDLSPKGNSAVTIRSAAPRLDIRSNESQATDAVISARGAGDNVAVGQFELIAGRTGGEFGPGFHTKVDSQRTITQTKDTMTIVRATASTSPSTGALVVAGGLGVAGNVNIGDDVTIRNRKVIRVNAAGDIPMIGYAVVGEESEVP